MHLCKMYKAKNILPHGYLDLYFTFHLFMRSTLNMISSWPRHQALLGLKRKRFVCPLLTDLFYFFFSFFFLKLNFCIFQQKNTHTRMILHFFYIQIIKKKKKKSDWPKIDLKAKRANKPFIFQALLSMHAWPAHPLQTHLEYIYGMQQFSWAPVKYMFTSLQTWDHTHCRVPCAFPSASSNATLLKLRGNCTPNQK